MKVRVEGHLLQVLDCHRSTTMLMIQVHTTQEHATLDNTFSD